MEFMTGSMGTFLTEFIILASFLLLLDLGSGLSGLFLCLEVGDLSVKVGGMISTCSLSNKICITS